MLPDIEIIIPALPPSKNRRKQHWAARRRESNQWHNLVESVAPDGLPRLHSPVVLEIQFCFPDRRKRDTQNYLSPALFDSLTPSKTTVLRNGTVRVKRGIGVIEDDSSECIRLEIPPAIIIAGTKQTVIRLWELKD